MSFRFYSQLESVDCGPACLRMVLAHHGKDYSLNELKDLCHVTRVGITLHDIISAAKNTGFDTSAARATIEQIEELPLPAILFWRQEHYVVLHKIERKRDGERLFHVADPAYGKIQLREESFQREWMRNETKGVILLLQPADDFASHVPNAAYQEQGIKRLVEYGYKAVQSHKGSFSLASLFFGVAMITNWLTPILFQRMIDQGVLPKSMSIVLYILLAQFFVFAGNIVSDYFSSKILLNVNFKLGMGFLSDFLFKIIRLPVKFFDIRLNTDLIQRMDDQERLQGFLTHRLTGFAIALFNLIAFSIIIFYYSAYSFLIYLFFSAASIAWTVLFLERRKVLDYSRFSVMAENKNNVYEMIMGMPEIKINNAQHAKISAWQLNQEKLNGILLRGLHLNYYQLFGVNTFNKMKDIAIIGLCAYLVINNRMTLGIMMSISYILGQLTRPIEQIVDFLRSAQDARLSFDRMEEIQRKEDENCGSSLPVATTLKSGFTIDRISFKYEGSYNQFVLRDVSLCIPKGKITAIVGTSGSGKTTLLKLLLGFYYPQQGSVLLNGQPFNQLDVSQWRSKCGVVMQDGYIFSGTIAQNIAIAEEKHDADRLRTALHMACIDEFVDSLPMGFNTKIGKSGIELSGGQKQRLLIARAVYKNPDFIFFDEATSSLDANNETRIMHNLDRFFQGKTVVVIAHRLSTVRNADQIIVLDKGSVVEMGHHHELVSNRNSYYELVRNQLELGN